MPIVTHAANAVLVLSDAAEADVFQSLSFPG